MTPGSDGAPIGPERPAVAGEPGPAAPGFERRTSLGFRSFRLAHAFSRALDRRLARHGVPVGQFRILLVLWEAGTATQTEIARHLSIEQPTVARTIGRMQRDGLVATAPDPSDARRVLITLTDRGRALREPLTAEAQLLNELAVRGLPKEEVQRLGVLMDRLAQVLEE